MVEYLPILLFLAVALAFPVVALGVSRLVQTVKDDRVKLEPYECGIRPEASARIQMSVRFYVIALLFVIFDVETVFLFPWAVLYERLLLFGLVEMGLFLAILFLGYWYAWKKGALEWA
jgi:NADH-quinone oxidoreductase subunit A